MTSELDEALERRVRQRLASLTKPPGSLGQLEEIAVRFALIRGEEMPSPARRAMYIFCADHGVSIEGVSAYPREVTQQMIRNFVNGGAAINVLCRRLDINPIIVDMGTCGSAIPGVLERKITEGTGNFAQGPAMSRQQAERALLTGRELAEDAAGNYDIVGLGEMGIGNTTAASAIVSVYSGREPRETAGAGTGLNEEQIERKAQVIERALRLHQPDPGDPAGVLSAVGGFEIAAIAGFIAAASGLRLPVVLDGFITCAAALIARALQPNALRTCFPSHLSSERGHTLALQQLGLEPYFDFKMRLGEGTGAALMMGVIDSAVRLYREMATFSEASVSTGDPVTNSSEIRPVA
jgi:nicotinate-nucleotide--dimethylbenzimidazole phosphoribosyltransferase